MSTTTKIPIPTIPLELNSTEIQSGCEFNQHHNLFYDQVRGENICIDCGLVVESHCISPEFSLPYESEKSYPVGKPKKGIVYERIIKLMKRDTFYTWTQRRDYLICEKVKELGSSMNVQKYIQTEVENLVKKGVKTPALKGFKRGLLVRSAYYYIAKKYHDPLIIKSLIEEMPEKRSRLLQYENLLRKHLNLPQVLLKPSDYIPQILSEMTLPPEIYALSLQICEIYTFNCDVAGKNPLSIAAGAILLAAKMKAEKIVLKSFARTAGVSEITIKKRFNQVLPYIPDSMRD